MIIILFLFNMATFKFIFRPSTKAGRHPGSLSLRVIHGRKPKTVSLSCLLYPEEWDGISQTILYPGGVPERRGYLSEVHKRITDCAGKVNRIIRRLEERGSYTVNDIVELYRSTTDNAKLLGYARTLAGELQCNGQYRTAKAYGTVCRGLIAFNNGVDLQLSQINAGLIKRFENYLKENGRQPNTISYYMRNLRAIYNKAVLAKRIIDNGEQPFSGVFTGVEETKRRALTADEVNQLKNIDFESLMKQQPPGSRAYIYFQKLYYSWRLFFFALYAHGMCFIDLAYLKKKHIKDGILRYYRKKTGRQIEVPMNEGMQKIIESFAEESEGSEYLFPIMGKQDGDGRRLYETAMRAQNRRLKRLSELAGIGKNITTHVARHSWATICKNELLPLSVICEGLGHSSENMTRKYLASFDYSILGNAGKAVLTAISRPSSSFTVSKPIPV